MTKKDILSVVVVGGFLLFVYIGSINNGNPYWVDAPLPQDSNAVETKGLVTDSEPIAIGSSEYYYILKDGEFQQIDLKHKELPQLNSRGNIDRDVKEKPSPAPRQDDSDEVKTKKINQILRGKLKGQGRTFVEASKYHGIDTYRQVAIACQETGFGESQMLKTHNNVGGISQGNGFRKFASVEESIWAHAQLLAKYKQRGLITLTDIKPVYCPDSDPRDTKGLNKYWLPNTLKIYNMLQEAKV